MHIGQSCDTMTTDTKQNPAPHFVPSACVEVASGTHKHKPTRMSAYVVQLIVQVGMMSAQVRFAHRDVAKVPSKWAEECVVNTGGVPKGSHQIKWFPSLRPSACWIATTTLRTPDLFRIALVLC